MRNRLTFLFIFTSIVAVAQVEDSTSRMPPQVAGVLNFPKQFFFFDITQNGWLNAPEGVETKFISGGLNINFLYEFNIIGSHLGIAPGLSYSVSGVKSNAFFMYQYGDDGKEVVYTDLTIIEGDSIIEKSKLSVSYLEIPVEVHIHLKPNERGRSFLIAPGFRGGVKVGDFWKLNYNNNIAGVDKIKLYGVENLSPFRYGVSLRLMYYKFGLFGYYQLNHLFEGNKGPDISPFSVGITISPF
ncbi:MAG TPA: outer membrane beta-barrel protein [Chitinophagales bacterium]|nr:outer membrane beta-barrel protein [Chitinophagales bacterium]